MLIGSTFNPELLSQKERRHAQRKGARLGNQPSWSDLLCQISFLPGSALWSCAEQGICAPGGGAKSGAKSGANIFARYSERKIQYF